MVREPCPSGINYLNQSSSSGHGRGLAVAHSKYSLDSLGNFSFESPGLSEKVSVFSVLIWILSLLSHEPFARDSIASAVKDLPQLKGHIMHIALFSGFVLDSGNFTKPSPNILVPEIILPTEDCNTYHPL